MLIHNSKIPHRIEIYISTSVNSSQYVDKKDHGEDVGMDRLDEILSITETEIPKVFSKASLAKLYFQRLGYVSFDDNAKTKYRARELKSVPMNVKATFIKLVIHSCHRSTEINNIFMDVKDENPSRINSNGNMNPFNQVGIVSIGLFKKIQNILFCEQQESIEGVENMNTKKWSTIATNTTLIEDQSSSTKQLHQPNREKDKRKCKKPMNSNEIANLKSRVSKLGQTMHRLAEVEVRRINHLVS